MSSLGEDMEGEAVTFPNCDLETPLGIHGTQDPEVLLTLCLRGNIHQLCSLDPWFLKGKRRESESSNPPGFEEGEGWGLATSGFGRC